MTPFNLSYVLGDPISKQSFSWFWLQRTSFQGTQSHPQHPGEGMGPFLRQQDAPKPIPEVRGGSPRGHKHLAQSWEPCPPYDI